MTTVISRSLRFAWASALCGLGIASAGLGNPLGITAEGLLGIPLEPGRAFWDYRTPTSLLEHRQFVVAVSGQFADLLNRQYRTGRENRGYAIAVGGGAIARWEYGVSGVWALGSGQAQRWEHPTGLYTLTPSPKIGAMAASHAWQRGPWAIGGTVYRTSFSLTDTFVFERYPTSSNSQINRYFYDFIPQAIGNRIAYDALGNRLAFFGDVRRKTRVGDVGLVLAAWTGSMDWLTQHTNTIDDTQNYRSYLAGVKTGDGHGGWHGTSAEGRWAYPVTPRAELGVRISRAAWSGDANVWLRNPARVPTEDDRSSRQVEPRDWGNDSVASDSWRVALSARWDRSDETSFRAVLTWEHHDLTTSAFGRTPVLTLNNDLSPLQQSAFVGLDGSLAVVGVEGIFAHYPKASKWSWDGGIGLVEFEGWADTRFVPYTVGFRKSSSSHSWMWENVRLMFAEITATRQITRQLSLTYSFRQYLPLTGSWKRDDREAMIPGGVSGIKFGSAHQLSVAMRL